MKTTTLIAGLAIAALNALTFVPPLQAHAAYLVAGSGALALWLVFKAATDQGAPSAVAAPLPPAPPPPPAPQVRNLSEAEAIGLLGVFQTKGRLVDFLMDDIAAYSDAQVGAAARVVQQGCKAALLEHFAVVPVSAEREGTRVTVPAQAPAGDFELVGKIAGEPPFSGVLVHKGWKATSVRLPRSLLADAGRLPPIAPAQVELR
ncbi:MAG: DUF2760 domain-containing protein [Opitutaceae bacterium]|nr:DUF2760 domain-containing protein [Opitutaceae bacterium]